MLWTVCTLYFLKFFLFQNFVFVFYKALSTLATIVAKNGDCRRIRRDYSRQCGQAISGICRYSLLTKRINLTIFYIIIIQHNTGQGTLSNIALPFYSVLFHNLIENMCVLAERYILRQKN